MWKEVTLIQSKKQRIGKFGYVSFCVPCWLLFKRGLLPLEVTIDYISILELQATWNRIWDALTISYIFRHLNFEDAWLCWIVFYTSFVQPVVTGLVSEQQRRLLTPYLNWDWDWGTCSTCFSIDSSMSSRCNFRGLLFWRFWDLVSPRVIRRICWEHKKAVDSMVNLIFAFK